MAGTTTTHKLEIDTSQPVRAFGELEKASEKAAESVFNVAGAQDAVTDSSQTMEKSTKSTTEAQRLQNEQTRAYLNENAKAIASTERAIAAKKTDMTAEARRAAESKRYSEAVHITQLEVSRFSNASQKLNIAQEKLDNSTLKNIENVHDLDTTFKATTRTISNAGREVSKQTFNITLPKAEELSTKQLGDYVKAAGGLVRSLKDMNKYALQLRDTILSLNGAFGGGRAITMPNISMPNLGSGNIKADLQEQISLQNQATTALQNHISTANAQREALGRVVHEGTQLQRTYAQVRQSIDGVSSSASRGSTSIDQYSHRIDLATENIKEAAQEAKRQAKEFENIQGRINGVGSAFLGFLAAQTTILATTKVWDAAQQYKQLENQLSLLAKAGEDTSVIMTELFEIAEKSRQPIEAIGDTYKTFKENTTQLGLSQADLIQVTELAAKAISIGGSSANEAKNAMRQLGQALGAGALRGDEFNSVIEQTPGLARAIAAGLQITTAQLKGLANDGKLTTEVIVNALRGASTQIESDYAKMAVTVEQAFTGLQNALVKLVGENDFFSSSIATGIKFVADNIQGIAIALGLAITAAVGFKATQLIAYLSETGAVARATTFNMTALKTAIAGAGNAVTLANVKMGAFKIGSMLANTAVGALTLTWHAFNAAVKASVVGAILSAIVWGVQKVVEAVTDATTEVERLTEATKNLNDVQKMDYYREELDKTTKKLEILKDEKEELNEKFKRGKLEIDEYNMRLQMYDREISKATERTEMFKNQIDQLNQKMEEAKNPAPVEKPATPAISTPKLSGGGAKKISEYEKNIKSLQLAVKSLNYDLEFLEQTGTSSMTKLDELNKNLAIGAEGYTNLSQKQIQTLREQAAAYDAINAKINLQKLQTDTQAELEFEQQKLEILREGGDLMEQKLAYLQKEYDMRTQLLGLSELERQKVIEDQLALEQAKEQTSAMNALREEEANAAKESFIARLEEMTPSVSTFKNFAVSAFDRIGDAIGEAAVGGKVSFSDMARQIIKDFIKMTVKALAMGLMIKAIDSLTKGVFGAVMKVAAAKAEKGQNPGPAGNVASGMANMFNIGKEYMSGGYTGNYGVTQAAGVVHGQEFVFNAKQTKRLGLSNLEALHNGASFNDLADGKPAGAVAVAVKNDITVNNNVSNAKVSVKENQDGGITINIHELEDIIDQRVVLMNEQLQEQKG